MWWLVGCSQDAAAPSVHAADTAEPASDDAPRPFVPYFGWADARVAYDPVADATRGYRDEDGALAGATVRLTLVAADAVFFGIEVAELATFGCGARLSADPATAIQPEVGDDGSLVFRFPPGTLQIEDDPDPSVGMPGCSERMDDVATLVAGAVVLTVRPLNPAQRKAREPGWLVNDVRYDLVVGGDVGSESHYVAYGWPIVADEVQWGRPVVWTEGFAPPLAVYDLATWEWSTVEALLGTPE